MEIIISSVKFKADTALEAFVREKVGKLFFYQNDKIIRTNVVLREADSSRLENKVCEIKLMIPGNDHFVRKCTGVYEKSILQAVKALQKIIRRKKTKGIKKRRP